MLFVIIVLLLLAGLATALTGTRRPRQLHDSPWTAREPHARRSDHELRGHFVWML